MFSMNITNLTKDNFEQEVLQASGAVLIDFWASWCGPCRMLAPTMEQIAAEHSEIKVCKVNVDEEPELAQQFDVMSIPMIVAFKDGKKVKETVGVQPAESLLALLK